MTVRFPICVPWKVPLAVVYPKRCRPLPSRLPSDLRRSQLSLPRPAPLYTAKELIEAKTFSAWQTVQWREGTKGKIQVQAVAIRVHWATGSPLHSTSHSRVHTGPEGWLMTERPVPKTTEDRQQTAPAEPQDKPEDTTKYWWSRLPKETSLEHLVLLAHARYRRRAVLRRCQTGMWSGSRAIGRFWNGLHRHLALVMLAYSFLMLQRLTQPLPPGEAFPPSVTRSSLPYVPSTGAALALSGSCPLAYPDSADPVLSSP